MCYKLYTNYRDTELLREAFFVFAERTFGIHFKQWYQQGFWGDDYICYSLVDGGQIISNVSLSKLKLMVEGNEKNAIQIATVGTLKAYRGKGLSRQLMETVLSEYADKVDAIFLSANNSVVDFYPRFGFRRVYEYAFTAKAPVVVGRACARKLDLMALDDLETVVRLCRERTPVSKVFCILDYTNIFMWYMKNYYGSSVWYLDEQDLILVCEVTDDTLHIYDIVSSKEFVFNEVLSALPVTGYHTIRFYFTPDRIDMDVTCHPITEDDPFFVQGDFPIEGRAFKVPQLAQT